MNKWTWALLAVALFYALSSWKSRPLKQPAGQLAVEQPDQQATERQAFQHGPYQIQPLASYRIKARVLGSESYRFDAGADLAPLDLALGWGPMSDSLVLDQVEIRQSGRFFYGQAEQFPIPRRELERHSANVHLVPANEKLAKRLKSVRVGQIISLTGLLIEARRDSGWTWRSSLTRDDVGDGACELFWVEDIQL